MAKQADRSYPRTTHGELPWGWGELPRHETASISKEIDELCTWMESGENSQNTAQVHSKGMTIHLWLRE